MIKHIVHSLVIILMPFIIHAAQIKSFVDTDIIAPGDAVSYTIIVEDDNAEIDTSVLEKFRIVSHNVMRRIQSVNMKTTRQYIHKYQLIPLSNKNLVIPAVPVRMNDQVYYTKPVNLQISKNDDRQIYVTAEISNSSPFVHEQIVYTFRLFTSVNLQGASLSKPDFHNFQVEEMGESRNSRNVINGREYYISEMNYLLIPDKAGSVIIKPAVLECGIVIKKQNSRFSSSPFDSFFDDSFFGSTNIKKKILQTDELNLIIRPLPKYNGSGDFSGLVGEFELSLKHDSEGLKQGESATLTLKLEGTGNIKDAMKPDLDLPDHIKRYDDHPVEEITMTQSGYHGKKVFKTAIVPLKAGPVRIDPVQLIFFNIHTQDYETIVTDPVEFLVGEASVDESLDAFSLTTHENETSSFKNKKNVEFIDKDILPIKDDSDSVHTIERMSLMMFLLLLLLPPVISAGYIGIKKYVLRDKSTRDLMKEEALSGIDAILKGPSGNSDVLSSLHNSLINALGYVQGEKTENISLEEGVLILEKAGFKTGITQMFQAIFCEIETSKYSGIDNDSDKQSHLIQKTVKLVREITK